MGFGGSETHMDEHRLGEMIEKLVVERQHEKAEKFLLHEYNMAESIGDKPALDAILAQLVFVYATDDPPNIAEGKRCCLSREKNRNTAYNMLQTGMFLFYPGRDYSGVVAKMREAIAKGKEEDTRTVYASLCLLGRALLELDRLDEATDVLMEIEKMRLDAKPFVVGDETVFLESAFNRGLEVKSVKRIAAALAPLCRDPEFRRRLQTLANR